MEPCICLAVQHAHQKGVIHRDLKPANILVDKEGQPHVLDFGLAKITEGGQQISLDGEVAGTPAFMSPEQAAGHLDKLDTRSDVYTLGVILFYLLSGKYPPRYFGLGPGRDEANQRRRTQTAKRDRPEGRLGTGGIALQSLRPRAGAALSELPVNWPTMCIAI